MSEIPEPLMEIIEHFGLIAKWEARGIAIGKAEGKAEERKEGRKYFLSLLEQGLSVEEIKQRLTQPEG